MYTSPDPFSGSDPERSFLSPQSALIAALAAFRSRDYPQAKRLCRQVLSTSPNHPDAYHLLSLIALRVGEPQLALQAIQTALQLYDQNPEFFCHYGVICRSLGQDQTAIAAYQQALTLNPDYIEAHFNLANVLKHQGQLQACVEHYQRVLNLDANHWAAQLNLAQIGESQGQFETAINLYQGALKTCPASDRSRITVGLARCLAQVQRQEEAIAYLHTATQADPRQPLLYLTWSRIRVAQGRWSEAIEILQAGIDRSPNQVMLWKQAAQILLEHGESGDGVVCWQRVVELDPEDVEAHLQLGSIYTAIEALDKAEHHLRRVLQVQSDSIQARVILSQCLREQDRISEATEILHQGLQIAPDHPQLHLALGQTYLRAGDLHSGLTELEWRYRFSSDPDFSWTDLDLSGQRIGITWDPPNYLTPPGLGEVICYLRFISRLADRGAEVYLQALDFPWTEALLMSIPGLTQVIRSPLDPQTFDRICPLTSLPHRLGITVDSIPTPIPYLQAPQQLSLQLPPKPQDQVRIGIITSPQPWDHLSAAAMDRRSCPLSHFQQLLTIPGVQLYNLCPVSELDRASLAAVKGLTDLSLELTDLSQVAAVMDQFDLMISIDTAYVHLAGAMGKTLCLVLPSVADWIWQQDRSDSPWYPTFRLYRQPRPGDWQTPFRQITWEVRALLASEHEC